MDSEVTPVAHPLVVQHNALVNARFDLNTTGMRLFLAMLSRLKRDDTNFPMCQLSVRDIMDSSGSNNYDHVRRMLKAFASRTLVIEKLTPQRRPTKDRKFVVIPLLAYAEYQEGDGMIEAQFNDHLREYLLELRENFTKAQITELLKLKSANSYRIYWLLREYAAFGKRTIKLVELKAILGLSEGYERFNNFRMKVLDRAQQELADTDLPFTYELLKQGRTVTDIRFTFSLLEPNGTPTAQLGDDVVAWQAALLAVGISVTSLVDVQARLAAGDYDEGYVYYVLAQVKTQVQAGKVKKEGGAVFKALTEGYMLPAYRKARQAPASAKVKASPPLLAKRKKLLSQLDDALNSLTFIKTTLIYNDDTRLVAQQEAQAVIADLEKQIAQLGI